jgi:hypothetical protein
MIRAAAFLIVMLAMGASTCSSGSRGPATELLRMRSGDLTVVLLSDGGALAHDRDTVVVEFRLVSDDSLVDVGTVKASATMPMPGGSPMFGGLTLGPTAVPGRYEGTSNLGMAGTWLVAIEWEGPRGSGSTTLSPMVQ